MGPEQTVDRRNRELFLDGVMTELWLQYGDHAAALAEEAMTEPDLLDPIGAAHLAGISTFPTPKNERETAIRWAREVGFHDPPAGLDPGVMSR